ncbi:MAG: hypothetical protein ACK40S_11655, partial [Burkholderiaceae bacterium]
MPEQTGNACESSEAQDETGTLVQHVARPELGEGRITRTYPNGRCDAHFSTCTFTWIERQSLRSSADIERERIRIEEMDRLAAKRAKQETLRREQERQARVSLLAKLKAGISPNQEELMLLRSLDLTTRLKIFSELTHIEQILDDVIAALQEATVAHSGEALISEFWRARHRTELSAAILHLAPAWWKERFWHDVRYTNLTLEQKIKVLSSETLNISKELRREVVATLAKREQNANYLNTLKDSLSAASLRLKIEILEALTSNSLKLFLDHAIDALSTAKSITEPPIFRELIHLFWEAHWRSLDSRSPLFELAPRRIQKNILRKQYSSHIWSLSELFSFRPTSSGLWSAPDVCGALNKTDQDLAEKWLPMRAASAEDCARMLSARAAERIASWFYENLGHEVEDIASHQLTGVSSSWKTFDLLIDGNKPVDVKNARLPNSARAFHLEHIVPRFKQDRSARDVVIAGVASPFLSLRELTKRDPCDPHHREFTYLGETSKEKIAQICTSFKNGTLELTGTRNPSPIQPWYFDYPDEWFKSFTEECARLKGGKQPENLHSELLYDGSPNRFPLAQHIAAGLPLPDWLIRKLTPWHCGFIANLQKLHDNRRPRLAELFLTILSDFLNNIHTPSTENYAPSAYRSILYQQ